MAHPNLGKKDRSVVARAVQDVNNVDAFGRLADDTLENLVTAANAVTHATVFVARHNLECE